MSNILNHPKPFYGIFILEIWERFGYTAVISILAVFFVKDLGLSEADAFILFGAYSALIYSFIAIGGFIGDHVLGAKRTIIIGLLTLLSGYLLLGFGGLETVYLGMGFVCVGTGLFKSNPSSLLAKCYKQDEPEKLHNAFTMFYMAINIGSVIGLFISPVIGDVFGFKYSFLISGIGIFLALVSFLYTIPLLKNISTVAGAQPLQLGMLVMVIVGTILLSWATSLLLQYIFYAQIALALIAMTVLGIYLSILIKQTGKIKSRMILALILMSEGIVFFILYGQMQTSINFFAINNVEHSLFGFQVNPLSFQSLNPFWVVILSPPLAYFYMKLKQKGIHFNIYNKFATGMLLCSSSFLVLYICKFFATQDGIISSGWLVFSYFLQSSGELLISALGVAMVAELVPSKIAGFVMGMWFVFFSIGLLVSGYVATLTAMPEDLTNKVESLNIYTDTFLIIGLFALVAALSMFAASKYKAKLI